MPGGEDVDGVVCCAFGDSVFELLFDDQDGVIPTHFKNVGRERGVLGARGVFLNHNHQAILKSI